MVDIAIEKPISLQELLDRWEREKINGDELAFNTVEKFVRNRQLTAYGRREVGLPDGHKKLIGVKMDASLGLNGAVPLGGVNENIFFDTEDVHNLELKILAELTTPSKNEDEEQDIPLDQICKKMYMSHQKFIDFLNDDQLAAANQRISALQAELDAKEKQLVKCKEGTSTLPATNAKLKESIESWQKALPTAVKATLACIALPEKKRTRAELRAIFDKCGELSETQFEIWRDALPDTHKDAINRATYPPNTDENLAGVD